MSVPADPDRGRQPKEWTRRLVTFGAVGVAATIIHGAIAWALVDPLGGLAANAIGFVVALSVTYIGNYTFTFRSAASHGDTLVRFLVVSGATLALSQWVFVFLDSMGASEKISVLLAVVAIPLMRFGVMATHVFADDTAQRPLVPWLLDVGVWIIAVAVGIAALMAVAPVDFMEPDAELWRYPAGDAGVGVAGMRYYLDDDWHWPLLLTDDLNVPDGTIVAFTDSIPLMALGAKAARPLIGHDINYFPSWFFLAYSLQGVGGVVLLRSLGVRRRDALIAGAVMTVTFPAFVFRSFHPALSGQFILLFTLAAAFASRGSQAEHAPVDGSPRAGDSGRASRAATGACLVSALLIHPYLLFMVAPLVAGIFVDHWRAGRLTLLQIARTAGGTIAALVVVMAAGGYLGSYAAGEGYGDYGMNVLGPVYPQISGLLPGDEPILSAGNAARWEGFNWLGFGSIGLIIAAAAWVLFSDRDLPRRWLASGVAMIALTITAISHFVTYGRSGVFEATTLSHRPMLLAMFVVAAALIGGAAVVARPPERKTAIELGFVASLVLAAGIFMLVLGGHVVTSLASVRASGRLWWPIGMLLVLAAIAILARSSARWVAGVFAVAIIAQIIDTQPVRDFAAYTMVSTIDTPGLDVLASAVDASDLVTVSPSFFCAPYPVGTNAVLDAIVVAAETTTPIDTVYTARAPKELDCGRDPDRPLLAGEIRVLVLPDQRDPGVLLDPSHRCRDNARFLVCTEDWADLAPGAVAPFLPVVSEPVTFGQGGDADRVMIGDWLPAQVWGRTIPSAGSSVSIPLIGVNPGAELIVRVRLRTTSDGPGSLIVGDGQMPEQTIEVAGTTPDNYELRVVTGPDTPDRLDLTLGSGPSGMLVGIDELTVMLAG